MVSLSHAILIEGGGPGGRMAKAVELLKIHFEDDAFASEKIDAGTFEDLFFIEPEDGKDIKVGQIESLISLFIQKPFASTGKACVITNGERMNEYAQNKLLKLLEEPMGRDMIIILAENAQLLLPTIRSRLMRVWLGYALPEEAELGDDIKSMTAALIYGKGSIAEANFILSRYEGSREEAAGFIGSFQLFLRSLVVGNQLKQDHAIKAREGVLFAEKALKGLERGDRVRYVLRRMALSMRAGLVNI